MRLLGWSDRLPEFKSDAWTLSLWIRRYQQLQQDQVLLQFGGSEDSFQPTIRLLSGNGAEDNKLPLLQATWSSTRGPPQVLDAVVEADEYPWHDGQWVHACLVWTSGFARWYIQGRMMGEKAFREAVPRPDGALVRWATHGDPDTEVSMVRLFSVALSDLHLAKLQEDHRLLPAFPLSRLFVASPVSLASLVDQPLPPLPKLNLTRSSFTFFWRPREVVPFWRSLWSIGLPSKTKSSLLQFRVQTGERQMQLCVGEEALTVPLPALALGGWCHVSVVLDLVRVRVLVDGVVILTKLLTKPFAGSWTEPLFFAPEGDARADIYQLRVFDIALGDTLLARLAMHNRPVQGLVTEAPPASACAQWGASHQRGMPVFTDPFARIAAPIVLDISTARSMDATGVVLPSRSTWTAGEKGVFEVMGSMGAVLHPTPQLASLHLPGGPRGSSGLQYRTLASPTGFPLGPSLHVAGQGLTVVFLGRVLNVQGGERLWEITSEADARKPMASLHLLCVDAGRMRLEMTGRKGATDVLLRLDLSIPASSPMRTPGALWEVTARVEQRNGQLHATLHASTSAEGLRVEAWEQMPVGDLTLQGTFSVGRSLYSQSPDAALLLHDVRYFPTFLTDDDLLRLQQDRVGVWNEYRQVILRL